MRLPRPDKSVQQQRDIPPLFIKSKKEVISLHPDEKNLKNFNSNNSSREKIPP
jgi:hypothetical protein